MEDSPRQPRPAMKLRWLVALLFLSILTSMMGSLIASWSGLPASTLGIIGVVGAFVVFVAVPVAFMIAGYK